MRRSPLALTLALTALALAAPGAPASAQTPCELRLPEAEDDFALGRFEELEELLEPCLAPTARPKEKAHAYRLLAKSRLALDDLEGAREAVRGLLRLVPDYEPEALDSPRFVRLIDEVRVASGTVQVTSVSKTGESLREAPATVVVLTAEEIERRGYLDLEALFHDLPGFDVSRANGTTYANLYQRGYRSATTDRTLLLVDGIEHNDLTSNVAFLSRQYPLADVDRVEVIYGPASTIYGANAFVGVINVITKQPKQLLGDGQPWSVRAFVGGGDFQTRYVDSVIAGRVPGGAATWSLTTRLFQSDEQDLSGFADWDYDPAHYDRVDYARALGVSGVTPDGASRAQAAIDAQELGPSPYYVIERDPDGTATSIALTPEGVARARELDRAAMSAVVGGEPVGFSDLTDDWWVSGKLATSSLELGFQTWERREGSVGWNTDQGEPGADNGALWTPRHTAFYAKASHELGRSVALDFFGRYTKHDLGPDSASFSLQSYAGGGRSLADLAAGRPAAWQRSNLFRSSSQLRGELSVSYQPSDLFSLVSGVEVRDGSIQGDYVRSEDPVASETGADPVVPGGNRFDVRDLGLFVQASYVPGKDLKLIAGGRLDENRVRENGGYGTAFSPRLAVIYSPRQWVFKAIYAEAFKDASNFNRFATLPGVRDKPNPDLAPEEVRNLELVASWERDGASAAVAAYQSEYSGIVGLRSVPFEDGTTLQFQNLGELRIRGLQADGTWPWRRFDLYANYTYTDPYATSPTNDRGEPLLDDAGRPIDELRVGDIARHNANAGVNAPLGERWNLNLRANYIGSRPTGAGTTVTTNPFRRIDSAVVAHGALTYRGLVEGLDLQLVVNNLFDELRYDPGIREAGGGRFAARLPQPGRAIYLRFSYRR
jgi:outer membrane receptor protein involved in Fe transport